MKKIGLFVLIGIIATSIAGFELYSTTSDEAKAAKEENSVIYLDAQSFKEKVFDYENNTEWKYEGEVPAILDFYADWCGPCKMLSPVLNNIQKEYDGKIQIYKINTDQQRELSATFGIRSLPTIVFVPLKGEPQAAMGYRSQNDLETMISEILQVEK
ncbi:thioredoxin [Carboxylicivirga sediminis]|uniref:Thioredoxin n=1 Tax=Carboxylicivirga sediminis TaxID=2006564 RepID=A0A941F887_9BACT|nr:thioredoxin [Carboxylicivirga sediminis]MBR8537364.1 thioredoxin [Carboxylicivirga sediminis]